MALYSTSPLLVNAEQYTAGKTSMTLVTLLSTYTDYTLSPAKVKANVQSLVTHGVSYTMNDTDWVVVGPNIEIVYTNAQFQAKYAASAGNAMSCAVTNDVTDPTQCNMTVWVQGSAGTVDIDWGDGTAHTTGAIPIGTSAYTHDYVAEGTYSLIVLYKVGASTVSTALVNFQAFVMPASINEFDNSAFSIPNEDSDLALSGLLAGDYPTDDQDVDQRYIQLPFAPERDLPITVPTNVVTAVGTTTSQQLADLMSGTSVGEPDSSAPLEPLT
jgi:hypothetical protein